MLLPMLTTFILFSFIPPIISSSESPDEAIKAEDRELRKNFFNAQLGKMENRIAEMEELLQEYYLKTDAFIHVYTQLDSQKIPIKSMKQVIIDPKSPNLDRFKHSKSLTDDEARVEMFQEEIQKLMKEVFSTEKLLSDLEHWGNFSNIYQLLHDQIFDIRQLESVNDNIIEVPMQSVLSQTMNNDSRTLVKSSAAKAAGNENPYFNNFTTISKYDKEIYGFIKASDDGIELFIFGAQTKRALALMMMLKEKFLNDIPKIFEHPKFKAVILKTNEKPDVEFNKAVKFNLTLMHIPHVFVTFNEYMPTSIMIVANVQVKLDEHIVMVLVNEERYIVTEYIYTEKGYKEGEHRDCENVKSMYSTTIRKKIIGTNNPVKIILHANNPGLQSMKQLREKHLKKESEKLIVLEEDWENYDTKFVFETIKRLFDKSYTQFYIPPVAFRTYMIGFECGGVKYPVILCEKGEILPFNKTVVIPKSPLQHFLAYSGDNDNDILGDKPLEFHEEAHSYALTLEIDADNFLYPHIAASVFIDNNRLTKDLDKKLTKKIPVIGFYSEISFIYIHHENKGYKVLKSWNGKLGKYLFISFDEEEPKFFEEAVEEYQLTCTSVVHNIIKTMSTPRDKLASIPTTGYSLVTDDNDGILFEVENYDGTKKSLTPASSMAMLLKKHLNAIKKSTGEEPNEIAFYLFDNLGAKKGLKKSCELLKIQCSFV